VIFREMVYMNENMVPSQISYTIERSNYIKYVVADHSLLLLDAASYATIDEEELTWITSEVVGDETDQELIAKKILRFVQSLRYETDLDSFSKYPLETLVDASGDCEDLAILAATMMKINGIETALIAYPDHVQVGIALDGVPSDYTDPVYYSKAGKIFYPAETSDLGWEIGDCAEQCFKSVAHILIMQ
jgi:transglutaminase-like putative cysteine protease